VEDEMKRLLVPIVAILLCIAIVKSQSRDEFSAFDEPVVNSPAQAAVKAPHRPTAFGLNLSIPAFWSRERSFMNLTAGGNWQAPHDQWKNFDPRRIDSEGMVVSLSPGEMAATALVRPAASYRGDVAIECRYQGKGTLAAMGAANVQHKPGQMDFLWPSTSASALIRIDAIDPTDRLRHIDCRERGADWNAVFDKAFVDGLRPYKAVRYLDWQQANENVAGNWARRTPPTAMIQAGPQGVAVEHLVLLANQAQVDPWFVMPFNADKTYTTNFAKYVHDNLAPGLTAYVEVGNEVWNLSFPAARQALEEGERAKLGTTRDEARMRRYAQKANESFKIWGQIFANEPERLVRILSGQNAWTEPLKIALAYRDTASHIEALSTAPYFGQALLAEPPANTTDLAPLFKRLDASFEESLVPAMETKKMADERGLRFIGYEGGQHITYAGPDKELVPRLNRDPRMAETYRKYLAAWDSRFGDMLMMLASSGPAGQNAAFGMVEYSGQPMEETPKRKAVLNAIAKLKR
jgi:hypothetical protein